MKAECREVDTGVRLGTKVLIKYDVSAEFHEKINKSIEHTS